MKSIYYLLLTLFITVSATAQSPKGKDVVQNDRLQFMSAKKNGSKVSYKQVDGQALLLIETLEQPKFIYNYVSQIPLNKQSVEKGQVTLFSFQAKTETSSEETGEAKVHIQLKQSGSYKDNLEYTLNIGSNWRTYYIPFETTKRISKEDLAVVLQYGYSPQSFSIKDVSFKIFEKGTQLSELPKTEITYKGMEADAQWRKDANARIETLQKGNFSLQFTKDGKPVSGEAVQVTLKQHRFPFGAMMHADDVLNDAEMYSKFKKAFSHTVLGNDLKIKRWIQPENRPISLNALKTLHTDGVSVKGHVLIWPGFQYNPSIIKKNKNNPEQIKTIVRDHITSILDATNGLVTHWDVTNETYTNRDFQKVMNGEEFLYEGFNTIKESYPNVGRFTNEYGIISKGGIDAQKQQWYYDYIKRVDAHTGNAVQGIGIQSHMGSDLTPPERVLELLAYYATLGKQISISEFTMDVQDAEVREQYTRDFMITAFSHPNVTEFMFWGFQDDGRGKVDIYEEDGSLGEMGKAFFSLVDGEWKTELSGKTDKEGLLSGRGFFGVYEYTYVDKGEVKSGTFTVAPRSENTFQVEL